MEELITLLMHLVGKVPYLSEAEHDAELDLLRAVQEKLGVAGIVPPKAGPMNAPLAPPPDVPVPGPVAEPPPADAPPPPVSPEVAGAAPEAANAFADPTPEQVAALEAAGWTPPSASPPN
jgi:hypothetical protein